jgi:PKD repeat protein
VNGSAAVYATNALPTVATPAAAAANPVTGTSITLSVLGGDYAGESNLVYSWATTGSPPAAVAFSANGSHAARNTIATFTKPGNYSFLATITNPDGDSTTSSVTVNVVSTLTTLAVNPGSARLSAGASEQFTAAGYDQFGAAIAAAVTWSVASGGSASRERCGNRYGRRDDPGGRLFQRCGHRLAQPGRLELL